MNGHGSTATEIKGIALTGVDPHSLELSDGTTLVLDAEAERGHVSWRRVGTEAGDVTISYGDALALAGEPFAGYVRTRTLAEAEWMRTVADWLETEADGLAERILA